LKEGGSASFAKASLAGWLTRGISAKRETANHGELEGHADRSHGCRVISHACEVLSTPIARAAPKIKARNG